MIKHKSLRLQLTTIYSSVLILALGLLFLSLSWLVGKELYDHTDIILRLHAEQLKTQIITTPWQTPNINPEALKTQSHEAPGMLALISDPQGQVYFATQMPEGKVISTLITAFAKNQSAVFLNLPLGSQTFRFLILPTGSSTPTHLIIMGHPIDVIQKSLNSLYLIFIGIFVALVIPTILGSYLLAGRALKSVGVIVNEMRSISSENLSSRLSVPTSTDEMSRLATTVNQLLDRLESAFIREREFLAEVAHELKTPLATLKSSLEVTLTKPRTQTEYQKSLSLLLTDINRMSETLSDLLNLAWSHTANSQHLLIPISLTVIGKDLTEIGNRLAQPKDISFHSRLSPEVWVKGRKDQLFRALLNILENAVSYSPPQSSIFLRIDSHKQLARVTISDTGSGINPTDLPHIFDRFYRGHNSKSTHGSGLGLAISHKIITALGGQINVRSTPDHGTTFHITFPQTKPDQNVIARNPERSRRETKQSGA